MQTPCDNERKYVWVSNFPKLMSYLTFMGLVCGAGEIKSVEYIVPILTIRHITSINVHMYVVSVGILLQSVAIDLDF